MLGGADVGRNPSATAEFAAVGVTVMLETVRAVDPKIRFYQASSSEIFGQPPIVPQDPETVLDPLTPYGVAKAYGHADHAQLPASLRSPRFLGNPLQPRVSRRPIEYLLARVARGAAEVAAGLREELLLGDLTARRDWGYAPDYVRAMWLMVQQDEPGRLRCRNRRGADRSGARRDRFHVPRADWQAHVRTDPTLVRGPRSSTTSSVTQLRRGSVWIGRRQ